MKKRNKLKSYYAGSRSIYLEGSLSVLNENHACLKEVVFFTLGGRVNFTLDHLWINAADAKNNLDENNVVKFRGHVYRYCRRDGSEGYSVASRIYSKEEEADYLLRTMLNV